MSTNDPNCCWTKEVAPDFFVIKDGTVYSFESIEKKTCQLHGEFIGWQMVGVKIKTSGWLGATRHVYDFKSLHKDCQNVFLKFYPFLNEEG